MAPFQWAVKPMEVRTTRAAEGMRSTVCSTWKSVSLILCSSQHHLSGQGTHQTRGVLVACACWLALAASESWLSRGQK